MVRALQQAMYKPFRGVSLKNKIFFSILVVILIISAAIAFLARWILVSSLISELELRGIAIARTIAERGSSYILDGNYPELLSLIFDEAKLKERQHLVSYIFISDRDEQVISHTLTRRFPEALRLANRVGPGESKSVRLCTLDDRRAYDIAIPITQGIYRIGTVHVGLNKNHIDQLIAKLRSTFLGFISLIIVIIFVISLRLAKYITMPISKLTRISDELSKGNFDIQLDQVQATAAGGTLECPALADADFPCRYLDAEGRPTGIAAAPPAGGEACRECPFFRHQKGDEVAQLADSFYNMIWSIRLYRRRLNESEEKYRSLFDHGPDPIFVLGEPDLTILDANPRALEVYGFGKAELIGKPFRELAPDQMPPEAAEGGPPAGRLMDNPRALHFKRGHKPFYVNLHASGITYKGRPAIIVATTDITEMIEKDAQLIQASKMKSLGEMSAGIAHELNQPLNAIKMGSDYLGLMVEKGREIPREHLHQVVAEMGTQVERAAEIITTLRAFGRKADLALERVRLDKPIQAVYSLVRRQFELENIHIELQLAPGLPPVMAHDNRLQQVFFNLVANARDAIGEKRERLPEAPAGRIVIRTGQRNDLVVAEVQDDGIGIAEGVRDKIFEPFFSTKESSHDMGLGLAITYGIVKDCGGQIHIDSREGEGTTFRLSFTAAA
jgi:histidine kinase